MPQQNITTTPVQLPVANGSIPSLRNLGPGTVWIAYREADANSTDVVILLNSGDAYEWPHKFMHNELWASASEATNLVVGTV